MTFKTTARTLILSAAFIPATAWAGVVFEVETTYHSGSPRVETSEMSVEKPNLKMEIAAGEGGEQDTAIFRGDRRDMVVINHEEQYYMVMNAAAMNRMGGQVSGAMDQAMKEINKHLEGLDPKQREMMERMLKGNIPNTAPAPVKRAKSEFRKTGERATKNGYPCVKYEVLRGGEKVRELWVTDWNNVKGSQETAATFKEMAEFFEEMMDSLEGSLGGLGGGGIFDGASHDIDVFSKINGFPVVTREFEGGELESETVLESVTERDLDPDAFEPPKGYRLRTMGPQ